MGERQQQESQAQDRAHQDRRWQEDVAWLEMSGGVPSREKPPMGGWMASFERNPMLWTLAALALGGVAFFLVTRFLF